MKIYRVILDPKLWINDKNVDVIYPVGCSKTFTGFFTYSFEDAQNILNYLDNMYAIDTAWEQYEYPSVIIETNLDNVVVLDDFSSFKADNNPIFDKNELFVSEIIDNNKIKILKKEDGL